MILNEGFLKKYKSLRTQKPSIYNIEELYYKVIQLTLRPDGTLWLGSTPLQNEDIVLTTFPEFIDSSSNLNLCIIHSYCSISKAEATNVATPL